MIDSQEMLPTTESQNEEMNVTQIEEQEEKVLTIPQSQSEIVARLKELAEGDVTTSKAEQDLLKQAFYKNHKTNTVAAYNAYIEAGGAPEAYIPAIDPEEEELKAIMQIIKQKRAEQIAEAERAKAENLQKKLDIIERIKNMIATPEEANQSYNEFKELQGQWKEIKNIPAEKATELWKNYQLYVEQYYDLLKLNSEFREYDFRKNLEAKTRLCEAAEKLSKETDIISAFQQLQGLHQEYKEIGPVAKDLRESIWTRFKNASTVINKRHQEHFEAIKAKEEENLARKTNLCEQIEIINFAELKTFADWDKQTKLIIDLQAEWKTIGFAPQKMNVKIFERFRAACDTFFEQKASYFQVLKDELNQNLAKKKALCEKAEAMKESTDWKATGDAFIKMQEEWKSMGAVPRKYSDALWKQFVAACDYFFEQKNKASESTRSSENENLAQKKNVIEQLKALAEGGVENIAEQVRQLTKKWNEIGHVPFKEKDKVYAEYKEIVDKLYKELNTNTTKRRLDHFKNSLKTNLNKEGNSLQRERERLIRAYEAMKNDIQTYENNLGFLNSRSKSGNSLVNDLKKKVDKLKGELSLIVEKIKTVDDQMKNAE